MPQSVTMYQTFAKKRLPPLQKGAIFQNVFLTKKSLGTQSSYIWWYPEGLGVPETHLFACYSSKCKLLHLVCKLQHQFLYSLSNDYSTQQAYRTHFYSRYTLAVQYRITYKTPAHIFGDMTHINMNIYHNLKKHAENDIFSSR